MITGIVNVDNQATIQVTVLGPSGRRKSVEALIDTGFDGFLSLPPEVIDGLMLRWRDRRFAVLADGKETVFDVYLGAVLWNGKRKTISILETDATPFVGMSLLNGYELKVQVRPEGDVTIKRMRR